MTSIQGRVLRLDAIVPSPDNVRKDLGDLDELAASIKAQGILQPLIVQPDPRILDRYVLVDGHRRWHAARRAGLPAVPVLIAPTTGESATVATMLATAMHKQLAPIEAARAFQRLRDHGGLTVADIARRTGYSAATVNNRLALLTLPADAQRMVEDKTLTVGAATELAKQVRATKSGTVMRAEARQSWLTRTHRLAADAKARCTDQHRDTRTLIGAIACGVCWEASIREDERARGGAS